MTTAFALYENCRYGDPMQVDEIEPPADRTTPEGIASYLRFGGRISDRVLQHFTWNGQTYDAMGQPLD
ncbi:hypothetical protein ACLM45_13630 [Synechococcus sp. A10-1-5-9]|uniref:hypothetical protein n=1 Tax=Synechococcus sp. A10-1-5-9 TaxID=3392295 RepID=UPI0039E813E0